jgi:hypothetical protein
MKKRKERKSERMKVHTYRQRTGVFVSCSKNTKGGVPSASQEG